MKTYLISAISIFAATAASAADVSLTGGSTSDARTSFGNYDNSTVLKLLAPSGGTVGYFDGNNKTVNKIWVNSSSTISADLTGGFVVDTNSADEAVAIDFAPDGANSYLKLGGNSVYTIKSSAADASSAVFKINMLGSHRQFTSIVVDKGSTLETYGALNILGASTSAAVRPTEVDSGFDIAGTVNIYSSDDKSSYGNFALNWSSTPSPTIVGSRPSAVIRDGGIFNVGNVSLDRYAVLQIKSGGTLNSTGSLNIVNGTGNNNPEGALIVDAGGKANFNKLDLNTVRDGKVLINGELDASSVEIKAASTSNVIEVGSTGKLTVSGDYKHYEGTVSVSGEMNAGEMNIGSDNLLYAYQNALLTVNKGGTLTADNITLFGDANDFCLTVNGTANISNTLRIGDSRVASTNVSVGAGGVVNASVFSITGKADVSGTLNLDQMAMTLENSQFTLNTGGVLNISGSKLESEITKATIKGTVNVKNGAIAYISAENGFSMTGGTLNIENGSLMQTKDKTGSGNPYIFVSSGNSAINVYGSGKLNLTKITSNTDDIKLTGGTLTVSSDNLGAILARKITFYSSKLVLNSKKTFASADGTYKTVFNIAGSCTADVVVNDIVQIGEVWYAAAGGTKTTLKLTFDNDGVFVLDTFKFLGSSSAGSLVFTNFNTEKVFLLSMSALPSWLEINGTAWNGRTLVKADFSLEAGTFEGVSGWWLYASNVPEPATYAAILGALAIAYALVRRRRSR